MKKAQPDADILAEDFIDVSTGAPDAGRVPALNADGKLDDSFLKFGFGGDGSDGALSISSGTTNIDAGGAQVFIKNYTSISITGTGALTFSNPHANGTLIILKSKGNVTITSSANPAVDVRGMGAAGGTNGGSGTNAGGGGTSGAAYLGTPGGGGGGQPGEGVGGNGTGGSLGAAIPAPATVFTGYSGILPLIAGGGGGAGGGVTGATAGDGGRGGGALYIECGGALNISSTINAAGSNGTNGGSNFRGAGGGGGGGGGSILILYNTLTSNTGTYTVNGGTGGSGGGGTSNGANGGGAGAGGGSITAGAVGGANSGRAGGTGGTGGNGFSFVLPRKYYV